MAAAHYIALIHKEPESGYGVSFPDVPGVTAVSDTLDDSIADAAEALSFAFEDWRGPLPLPRTLDELRRDAEFAMRSLDAVIAAIPAPRRLAAAE